ncbi:MAG: hypothetical protein NC124_13485 [Clostridium sp.]|nr:hypothetical protein [Clostridium sp.]
MRINCFYDEDMEYADIVYIPDMVMDVEKVQNDFFQWLFDKNNDHQYWIVINGEKKACKYGTQAFIEWINNTVLSEEIEKSYVIRENSKVWDLNNKSLVF